VSTIDGSAVTGASPSGVRVLDGGNQAAVGGSFSELGGGQYAFVGSAADYNADETSGFLFSAAGAVPVHVLVDLEVEAPDSGNSLKQQIYDVLASDAQIDDPANLGGMLGLHAAEPYGVYFRNPPEGKDLQTYNVVTFFIGAMGGRFPRDIYLYVTAWGADYETVQNRIYDLLDKKQLTTSDYKVLFCEWDSALSESWADDLKCYYHQHRYLLKGLKV